MEGVEKGVTVIRMLRATREYCHQTTNDNKLLLCGCLNQDQEGGWWCDLYKCRIELTRRGPHIGSWQRPTSCQEEYGG